MLHVHLKIKNILDFFSWKNLSRVNKRSEFDAPARSQPRKPRYASIISLAAKTQFTVDEVTEKMSPNLKKNSEIIASSKVK